jgi:hypothetical protein
MLNLPIAMMRVLLILFILGRLILQAQTPSAQTPAPEIQVTSPLAGSALQGAVAISGSTDLPGFQSSEVDFSYLGGGPGGWFLIAQSSSSVKGSVLGVWDTSKIADGNYSLRVQVTLSNGSVVEKVVTDLRVRNYTPIETNTPAPVQKAQPTLAATLTPTPATVTPQAIATSLPANPANMNPIELGYNMILGITATIIVFTILALYRWLKTAGKSH